MATTPIYGFVTPDLATTADGPAAMAALATRVEREMSTWRAGQEFTQEPNTSYPAGSSTDVTIQAVNVATSVIGWIGIDANVNLAALGGSSDVSAGAFAGYLAIHVDDVQQRLYRFHSLWGTRMLPINLRAEVPRTAAQTSTNIKLKMTVQSGLSVSMSYSSIYVTQYGAPATG